MTSGAERPPNGCFQMTLPLPSVGRVEVAGQVLLVRVAGLLRPAPVDPVARPERDRRRDTEKHQMRTARKSVIAGSGVAASVPGLRGSPVASGVYSVTLVVSLR